MSANSPKHNGGKPDAGKPDGSKPEWADGLKQLYDSVVDEPLPDSFKSLLAKLDEPEKGKGAPGD